MSLTSHSALLAQAFHAHSMGHHTVAEKIIRDVLRSAGRNADAWRLLGAVLFALQDWTGAAQALGKTAELLKTDPAPYLDQARCLVRALNLPLAQKAVRAALKISPRLAVAHKLLGDILRDQGHSVAALDAYDAAWRFDPGLNAARRGMADCLLLLDRLVEAQPLYQAHLREQPTDSVALNNLGIILERTHDLVQAHLVLTRALALRPDSADIANNLGKVFLRLRQYEQAETVLQTAISLAPNHTKAHLNLGYVLDRRFDLVGAERHYRRAVHLDPANVFAHSCLASLLFRTLRHDEGLALARRSIELAPHDELEPWKTLLCHLTYCDEIGVDSVNAFHRDFGHSFASVVPRPDPVCPADGRIKLGFISPDFRQHAVARNILPLFEHGDRGRFHVTCYSLTDMPDAMTDRFRSLSDVWRDVYALDDAAIADLVRQDKIGILLHLANHFDSSRPLLANHRAAPVQISFHDVATSGLSAMDYLIADRVLAPPRSKEFFAERLLRLPCFYLGQVPEDLPPVAKRAPNDPVAFGYFGNPIKLNRRTAQSWAAILTGVPKSTLYLKYYDLFLSGAGQTFIGMLHDAGVDPGRILVHAMAEDCAGHLGRYGAIDFSLDSHPFCGSTTSFESLLMGVPVLTQATDRMVSRWTASLLKPLGLSSFIATTPQNYVAAALQEAGQVQQWRVRRQDVRDSLLASSLCDGSRRAGQFHRLMQAVWNLAINQAKLG